MRVIIGFLSILVIISSGCYPDAEWLGSEQKGSIRLALSELGIDAGSRAVQNWLTWAGDGFDGDAFDMGVQGNDFALDLRLYDEDQGTYKAFVGEGISIDRIDGSETLFVDVKMDSCSNCRFFVSLFWKEDPEGSLVTVFDGESGEFSAQSSADPVLVPEFSITQTGSGTINCNKGQNDTPDGAWIAVRDENANIRFPHVQVDSLGQPVAVLMGIPTSHTMLVELDPLADGRFYSPFAEIILYADGDDAEVVLP